MDGDTTPLSTNAGTQHAVAIMSRSGSMSMQSSPLQRSNSRFRGSPMYCSGGRNRNRAGRGSSDSISTTPQRDREELSPEDAASGIDSDLSSNGGTAEPTHPTTYAETNSNVTTFASSPHQEMETNPLERNNKKTPSTTAAAVVESSIMRSRDNEADCFFNIPGYFRWKQDQRQLLDNVAEYKGMIRMLEEKLHEREQRINDLKEQHELLYTRLEQRLFRDLNDLRIGQTAMLNSFSSVEAEVNHVRIELEESQQQQEDEQLLQLQTAFENATEQCDHITADRDASNLRCQQLEKELEVLTTDYHRCREQAMSDQQQAVEAERVLVEQNECEKQDLLKTIAALQEDLLVSQESGAAAEQRLSAAMNEVHDVEQKLENAQLQILQLQEQVKEHISSRLESSDLQLRQQQEHAAQLEALRKRMQDEHSVTLEQASATMASELDEALTTIKNLNAIIVTNDATLISKNDEINAMNAELLSLRQQLKEQASDMLRITEENKQQRQQLNSKVENSDANVQRITVENEQLTAELMQTSSKLADMEMELMVQSKLYEEHQAAAEEELKNALANLHASYEEKISQIQEAQEEHLQELVDRHAVNVESKDKEILELIQCKFELESSAEKMKESIDLFQKENKKMTEDVNNHALEIERLKGVHEEAIESAVNKIRSESSIMHGEQMKEAMLMADAAAQRRLEETLSEQQQKLKSEYDRMLEQELELVRQKHSMELDTARQEVRDELIMEAERKLEKAIFECEVTAVARQEALLCEQKEQLRVANDAQIELLLQSRQKEFDALLAETNLSAAAKRAEDQEQANIKIINLSDQIQDLLHQLEQRKAEGRLEMDVALEAMMKQKDGERESALAALKAEMDVLLFKAYQQRDEYREKCLQERKLRFLQGNFRVICRIRPILDVERDSGKGSVSAEIASDEEIIVKRDLEARSKYEFDRIFAEDCPQEEIFEYVHPLCEIILDGHNACIFAYGQTGSGKTYTMEGDSNQASRDRGIIPRAIAALFDRIDHLEKKFSSRSYRLSLSMLEIYNESVADLLVADAASKVKLDVRHTPEGVKVPGLNEIQITSPEQVPELLQRGTKNRATGSHDMNERSSRSHSILTITCQVTDSDDGTITEGKLHLIDLAGSERVSKTDATGEQLKEAQNINKSLSALGDVINALGSNSTSHIAYRASKLTELLQDSLCGNSKVMTLINISPAEYNISETVCTLNFGNRCRSALWGRKQMLKPQQTESQRMTSSSSGHSINALLQATKSFSNGAPSPRLTSNSSVSSGSSAHSPVMRSTSGVLSPSKSFRGQRRPQL